MEATYMTVTLRQRKLNSSYYTPCRSYMHKTDRCIALLPVAQCSCRLDY